MSEGGRAQSDATERMALTSIFPHILLHKAVMSEALLADQRVSRRSGGNRVLVTKNCVGKLVIPLFPWWRQRPLWRSWTGTLIISVLQTSTH